MIDWKKVIENYKLKLANLNQRNRSLKIGRLTRGKVMDLYPLQFVSNYEISVLLDDLLQGKEVAVIKKLEARYPDLTKIDSNLNLLAREARKIYEETGSNELYLGIGTVFGKFIDGTKVYAPLLLLPVSLQKKREKNKRWTLKIEPSENYYNLIFLLAYQKFNDVNIFTDKLAEAPTLPFTSVRDFIVQYYENIKELGIDLKFQSKFLLGIFSLFAEKNNEDYEKIENGYLEVFPTVLLGIFPQGQKGLTEDYDTILKMLEENPGFIDNWLSEINKEEKIETEKFYPLLYDESQRKILEYINKGKSALLHGPPGTGKSQLIVNAIVNFIAQNKKIIVVSQKRAALEVLMARLKELQLDKFAFIMHDYKKDKNLFYKKLARNIEDFSNIIPEQKNKAVKKLRDIIETKLQKPFELLQKNTKYGLTIDKLYKELKIEFANKELITKIYLYKNDFTFDEISEFLFFVKQVKLYEEILNENFIWKDRKSFANKNEIYKEKTANFLKNELPKVLNNLKFILENYPEITKKNYNISQIVAYKSLLEEIINIDNIDKINLKSIQTLKKVITDTLKTAEVLKNIKYINPTEIEKWKSLKQELGTLKQIETSIFKIFKPVYHKTKGTFRRYLQKINPEVPYHKGINSLEIELNLLEKLEKKLKEIQKHPFFSNLNINFDYIYINEYLNSKKKDLALLEKFSKTKSPIKNINIGYLSKKFIQEQIKKANDYITYYNLFHDIKNGLNQIFSEEQIKSIEKRIKSNENSEEIALNYYETFINNFNEMVELDNILESYPDKYKKLFFDIYNTIKKYPENYEEYIKNTFLFIWINTEEEKNPELKLYSSKVYCKLLEEYSTVVEEENSIKLAKLKNKLKYNSTNKLHDFKNKKEFLYQIKKKSKLWSLRKLYNYFGEVIQEFFPVILASPETIASVLPMEIAKYDFVILDEASQCPIEEAFPVLLRGKKILISGDQNQLPPLNLFKVFANNTIEVDDISEFVVESESTIDFTINYLPDFYIEWHYRSLFPELIEFSNYAFYEGKLKSFPLRKNLVETHQPIKYLNVKGVWENNTNLQEAKKTVKIIFDFLKNENPPSLGVITFNISQQELILNLIEKKLEQLSDDEYQKITKFIYGNENYPNIFVKNIENVQGDERDIIIFSIGYAKDKNQTIRANFGLLNLEGGERRLNVAITRAKKQIIVITSIEPGELKVENTKNKGPKLLKKYLQYAKYIHKNGKVSHQYLQNLLEVELSSEKTKVRETNFYNKSKQLLQSKYDSLIEKVGSEQFFIDFADLNTGDAFILQGQNLFYLQAPYTRHYHLPNYLKKLGWNIKYLYARNITIEDKISVCVE